MEYNEIRKVLSDASLLDNNFCMRLCAIDIEMRSSLNRRNELIKSFFEEIYSEIEKSSSDNKFEELYKAINAKGIIERSILPND